MTMGCQVPGGECLVVLSAALAAEIAAGRSEEDLATLAAFLTSLADNLALIATRRGACESASAGNSVVEPV